MGNPTSKPCNQDAGDYNVDKLQDLMDPSKSSDPRSPTPDITRTPLKVGVTNQKNGVNITKNIDLTKTLNDESNKNKTPLHNPILSAIIRNNLQSFDPRSPTLEFERTPIVLNDKKEPRQAVDEFSSPVCRRNGNYELLVDNLSSIKNVSCGIFNMSIDNSFKECTEEPLDSSTVSLDATAENISRTEKRLSGLLETNFDYIETEYDATVPNKSTKANVGGQLDKDPRSPSIDIERTPIVISKEENTQEVPNECNRVESMSDEALLQMLHAVNKNNFRQMHQKINNTNSQGLLIYEDDCNQPNTNITPKKKKQPGDTEARTPLSCMKNKASTQHTRSKSANMGEKKANVVGSKIPKLVSNIHSKNAHVKVDSRHNFGFKNSSVMSKHSVAKCENSKPIKRDDCWDHDSSIVL